MITRSLPAHCRTSFTAHHANPTGPSMLPTLSESHPRPPNDFPVTRLSARHLTHALFTQFPLIWPPLKDGRGRAPRMRRNPCPSPKSTTLGLPKGRISSETMHVSRMTLIWSSWAGGWRFSAVLKMLRASSSFVIATGLEPSIDSRSFIQGQDRRFEKGIQDPVQPDVAVVCPAPFSCSTRLPVLEAIRI